MVSTNIAVTIQLLYMSIIANELYITLAASLGNHPHSHSHHHHNYHHLNLPSDQHQQQQQHVLHSSTLPSSTTTTNLYDATFIQHQRGQNDSLSSSSKSTVNGTDNNKLRSDDQIYTQNIHHTHKHHTSSSHHTHVHPNVQRAATPIISSIGSKSPPSTGSQHFGGQHGRPLVRTSKGVLRGITIQTPTGKYVDAFLGIPYAAPPTGQYRFRHPKPMQQWDGEYDATKFSPGCYQLNDTAFGNFSGSMMWNPNVPVDEDCLTLNIWVPKKRRSNGNNMACLLWIYGGGFSTGTTSLDVYNGSILAGEESIIVISVNYRLASLGFIYLGREDAPGNAGLFDQLMAIEWVRDNIAAFGGNPANITLFGESAGAASIAFHLLSPLSRNLFSQGILQSGSSTSPWAYIDRTEAFRRSLTLAKNIGCEISSSLNSFLTHSSSSTASSSSSSSPPSSSNSLPYISDKHLDKIIHCLQEADPIQLLTNEPPVKGVVDFAFVPIVDGSFLDEKPEVSLKSKNFKQTNLLVGSNHDEGTYWLVYHEPKLFNLTENVYVSRAEFEGYVKKLFADNPWIIQEAIMQEYTPWLNPDNQTENRDKIDKLVGDYHFACPGIEMAHRYAFYGNNVWNYYFTHRSSRSPWPSWMGVIHADEIMFLLGEPLNPELHYRDDEKELSTRMMRYWANFARTGDPNKQYPDDEHDLPSVRWPEYTAHGREYLVLSSTDKSTGRGLRAKECAFWNNFLPKLMKHNEDQKTCTNKSTSTFIQSISSFIFLLIFSLVLSVLFGPPSQ